MKRLLTGLAVCYGLGIILNGFFRLNFWLILGAAIAVLVWAGLVFRNKYLSLILILFLALLSGCLNLANSARLSKCHIRNFMIYKNNPVYRVSGFIASMPELKNGQQWFTLQTQEVQADKLKYNCCGKLLIKMDFEQALNYGDNLTLTGSLKRLPGFNSSSRSYRDFLARKGIYLIMPVKDSRQIILRSGASGSALIRNCFRLRVYLEQIISRYLPPLPASILSAMVLGQKRNLPRLVNENMVKSGTVHILVVSGFNVGIVAFIADLLLKILRLRRKLRFILTASCLLVYCLVTGATNPVIRATVMGIIFLSAYFLKRDPDIYNSLMAAALFILAFDPLQLFDIGFQLSFISVLAIVYFYPKFEALICLKNCRIKVLKFIIAGCLVSFSAWLGTVLIIALNFRIIAPVTVLANMIIVPLATLITLCGFTLVLSGLLYPDLAYFFSQPTSVLINLLLNINQALVKLPLAYIYF